MMLKVVRHIVLLYCISLATAGCSTLTTSLTAVSNIFLEPEEKELTVLLNEGWEFYALEGKLFLIRKSDKEGVQVLDYFNVVND